VEIEVKPHRPLDIISKKEVDGGQYAVMVDGVCVGFIGYHSDASVVLHRRYSPLEREQIQQAVAEQLASVQTVSGIVQPGEPVVIPKREEAFDDFD
jgi:hypothetical protein